MKRFLFVLIVCLDTAFASGVKQDLAKESGKGHTQQALADCFYGLMKDVLIQMGESKENLESLVTYAKWHGTYGAVAASTLIRSSRPRLFLVMAEGEPFSIQYMNGQKKVAIELQSSFPLPRLSASKTEARCLRHDAYGRCLEDSQIIRDLVVTFEPEGDAKVPLINAETLNPTEFSADFGAYKECLVKRLKE